MEERAMTDREQTKTVSIGNRKIGAGIHSDPVHVQYKDRGCRSHGVPDSGAGEAGCDIIRVAVPTMEATGGLKEIKETDSYSAGGGYPFRLPAGVGRD